MEYLSFEQDRKYDLILLGRIAIDFNPLDYYKTLAESETFRKYVGGSPANIAVGLSRLGKKCGFFARVSQDRFGEFAVNFFKGGGDRHLPYQDVCKRGEPGAYLYRDSEP